MNGAESLLSTLTNNTIDVCFTNPGTSEMHFVAALDEVEGMRCVLCLFEGVISGAADGYARMARKPASTLLHLGPGLGNALANVHNAKKGCVPMVNIVGDHATYHLEYDAPLTSDIEGIAGPVSHWVHTSEAPEHIARDAAEAIRQAGSHRIATLMLPADVSWGENPTGAEPEVELSPPVRVPKGRVAEAATRLKSNGNCMIMIGGGTELTLERGHKASKIAEACGAQLCTDVFPTRVARGAGTAVIERLPYLAERAVDRLKDINQLILIGAKAPVSFFAYPQVPSAISPPTCEHFILAEHDEDVDQALDGLMAILDAIETSPRTHELTLCDAPDGDLNANTAAMAIAHNLPENAVIVDEAITSGVAVAMLTATARRHDWLNQTGGSIGWGLAAAVGAAIACPQRKIVCLEGDGSAMYTIQALWTMAREDLDVTVVIFNNRKYSILELEFARTGARGGVPGPNAASVLDIGKPNMDFAAMAQGMGVKATRATTAQDFNSQFEQAMRERGPRLIDAHVPSLSS